MKAASRIMVFSMISSNYAKLYHYYFEYTVCLFGLIGEVPLYIIDVFRSVIYGE